MESHDSTTLDINFKNIKDHIILVVPRGSSVYGTNNSISDKDFIVIVNDFCYLGNHQMCEYSETIDGIKYDYQIIKESRWIEMIHDHDIVAIEVLYLPEHNKSLFKDVIKFNTYAEIVAFLKYYRSYFVLDPWTLRKSLSKVSSNSWVKCKKKLTIEKDYNLYIAQKSLFHSLRILMFAIDILTTNSINFHGSNYILDEIKSIKNPTWEKYNERFHELHNKLQSELRKLAPKKEVI